MESNHLQLQSKTRKATKAIIRMVVLFVSFLLLLDGSLSAQESDEVFPNELVDSSLIEPVPEVFSSPEQSEQLHQIFEYEPRNRSYPTGEISGFLQFDTAGFDQSADSVAAFGVINNKTAVRRARLALIGDLAPDVGYKLDADYAASGHPSARDVFLEFRNRPIADRLVFGNTKVPFQLEALTSSKDFTFTERAPYFTFAPFRQIGIWADGSFEDETGTWSIAGFRAGKGGFVLNHSDDGHGFAIRTTRLHWYEDEGHCMLHTGINYSFLQPYQKIARYEASLSFFTNQEPGISTPGTPVLVDTGDIPAEGVNLFNYELSGARGHLNYQTEITYALVNQINGPPLTFYGGYAQIGWFLTGEVKPYNRKTGVFGSVVPDQDFFDGGPGAWEFAFRATYLNLNDKNIAGGRLNSAEFILNWYLSEYVCLKLSCVRGFIDSLTADNVTLDTVGGRLQIIF